MSDQELFNAVEQSIRTVLNTGEGDVKMESSLVDDLGAESIDFLDISYELERFINFEVDFKEIFKSANGDSDKNDITVTQIIEYLKQHPNLKQ